MIENVRFQACWPKTLAQECPFPNDWSNSRNFSNDAHDAGGKTMCGIIQREYDHFRHAAGEPLRDVRQITRDEGEDIYYGYWMPYCDTLPAGLDLSFFDMAVNGGPHEATILLQRALNISADGSFGPQTENAIAALKTPDDVAKAIHAFAAERENAYRHMRGFPYFGQGWLRRTWTIQSQSQVMVNRPTT